MIKEFREFSCSKCSYVKRLSKDEEVHHCPACGDPQKPFSDWYETYYRPSRLSLRNGDELKIKNLS